MIGTRFGRHAQSMELAGMLVRVDVPSVRESMKRNLPKKKPKRKDMIEAILLGLFWKKVQIGFIATMIVIASILSVYTLISMESEE